jgi:hypothetical protein
MQEEIVAHEANSQPHEPTRARWQRRRAARPLPPVHTPWGPVLKELGVVAVFPGGTSFAEVIATINSLVQ